ncbi:Fic family protein [Roseateles sp. L2-2]|uniref:Fic family protein n=1 Tax=Roseateles TaxID=93681 RepID=UPI003D35B54D
MDAAPIWQKGPLLFVTDRAEPGLILGLHERRFDVFMPSAERPHHRWDREELLAFQPRYFMHLRSQPLSKQRWRHRSRYVVWGLQDFRPASEATPVRMEALSARLLQTPSRRVPASLSTFSIDGLLEAHRWLNVERDATFRDVDMMGFQPYAKHEDIRRHCQHLMSRASSLATEAPDFVQLARLVADFLLVHPFLDGNRRVSYLLISSVVRFWGRVFDPSRCPLAHFYFGVRLASRGHSLHLARVIEHASAPS